MRLFKMRLISDSGDRPITRTNAVAATAGDAIAKAIEQYARVNNGHTARVEWLEDRGDVLL